GGPVTVTDPDVDRFFMTIPEACQLVLQAAVVGETGETLVLDMGEPIKIAEVAKTLIEQSGKEIEIVYTGLRANEKLSEELFDETENPTHGQRHPSLSVVRVPPIDLSQREVDELEKCANAAEWLSRNAHGPQVRH
ncbi:polysaccharide biosynthesis protein, partial [Dietzia maris]|uniref:polysaccharide biosynthesis protein n=1 Tax=Dietzia maris TaxID=37915 RepID=UPI00344F215B